MWSARAREQKLLLPSTNLMIFLITLVVEKKTIYKKNRDVMKIIKNL